MSRAWLWLGLLVAFTGSAKELVLVDADLATQIQARPGVELRRLSGLDDLPGALAGDRWSRVSLISHGQPGALQLGGERLNLAFLTAHPDFLAGWRHQLTDDAQLELWGCAVAKDQGHQLIDSLSTAIARPVLASTDATGPAGLGGNLSLEYGQGREPDSAPLTELQQLLVADLTAANSEEFETCSNCTANKAYTDPTVFGSFKVEASPTNSLFVDPAGGFSPTQALRADSDNPGEVTTITVASSGGSGDNGSGGHFQLKSIYLDGAADVATTDDVMIHAFRYGAEIGSGTSLDLATPKTFDLSSNPDFYDIDAFTITGSDLLILMDHIMVDAPRIPTDSDGSLTAGGGSEPTSIATTAGTTTALDFTLTDGSTSDGQTMTVSQIRIHVSGTSSDAERGNVAWTLTGPDSSAVTGSYSSGVVTFSGLTISVADGGSETYTVNANLGRSGLIEGHTFVLSLNGDTDLTLGSTGTQMASTTAVSNGAGFATSVTASQLAFTTQPAGATSGHVLTTPPVVTAQDSYGNTDVDFTGDVSLSEASAGSLSGTTTVAAISGVAPFSNLIYTASADQEAVTLTAAASGLPDATANSVTADVVATRLIFTTQPGPTTISSGSMTNFITVPVVRAVDDNDTLDTGYSNDVVMSVTNSTGGVPAGTVNSLIGSGDVDSSGATVTLTPSGGSATFSGLTLGYTNAGAIDSLALRATSGSFSALSTALTSAALPSVTEVNISLSGASGNGGAYTVGDTVTATWNNTSSGDNNSDITSVTVDFSQFGGGASVTASNNSDTWTATYTLTAGSIDANGRKVSVSATNVNGTSTTTDDSNATVDNIVPTVTDAQISLSGATGTGGGYIVGDTITATWNNTASGDNNSDITSVTVDFSQFGGDTSVTASNNSNTWTATYTLTAGSIDATNRNISVTATDDAGNARTTSDTSNASVDSIPPTVSDANISLSGATGTGGAYIVGDTVTATWNNTDSGDNNSDTIAGVTVNFSAFGGGSAVAASNSSGNWTATYTLNAGSIDTTNRNISVTATDNAGNALTTSDTSNASVDNQVPTVSDANISLSGATGTGGAYIVGDTITATWNDTSTGDNNGDIASVRVDFSAFGGGRSVAASNSADTWSATYTLTAGSIEGSDLNLRLTATDNAGNSTTASDTSNATVDNRAPAAPSTPELVAGSDSGSRGDGITNDTTPTLMGTGEAHASLLVLDGATPIGSTTVDSGGNWTLTTSALSDGSHSLSAQQTDGAGNASSASAALNLTIDATAPNGYGLSLDQTAINGTNQNATSVTLSGADVGSQYQLTVSSSGGGTPVTASGTVAIATQQLTGLNVSGLADGTLTYSLMLTDEAGNTGSAATDVAVKDSTAPAGYSASFEASYVNLANQASQRVTLSGGESGDNYQLTISDSRQSVSRSGTLAGSGLTLSPLDLSPLADGTLTLSLILTDDAGNAGTAATASITKDTLPPTLQSSTPAASATDVALGVSPSLTFSEAMTAGTSGSNHISLTASDSTAVFDRAANDAAVSIHGATVSFTPNQALVPTLAHSLVVGSEALTDLAGNPFAGTSLSFTAASAAPVAVNDSFNLTEDTPTQLAVLGNDILARGSFNNASLVILSQAQHGSLTLNTATGILTYSPNADYNGSDSFSYQVQDSYGTVSNPATVNLTLAAVNDAPRAQDDSASLQAGDSLTLDVLANDMEVDDGDSLNPDTLVLVSLPSHGNASVQNGQLHYQASANYTGVVTMTYQVADNSQGALSNEATLTLTILAANAPVANADSASLDEDNSLDIDVLANDSGNSLDASSLAVVQAPQHGSVSLVNGLLHYVPAADYVGTDSVSYLVNDATGQTSNIATVSLTIHPVNDAPVAVADTSVLTGMTDMDINVKGNDSDVDNDNADLAIVLVSQPAEGTARVVNGLVRYTPSSTISHDDSFSYRLVDPSGAQSAPVTVNIVLALPNQAPLAVDDSVSTPQNQAITIAVLANDSDSDGSLDYGSLNLVTAPGHGSVSLVGGQISYTPATDFHGDDSLRYQVADNEGAQSNSATVSIRVLRVNQAPVAANDSMQVMAGQANRIPVLANDHDNDGSLVSVELRQLPTHGSALVQEDGSISYTAQSDYQGSDHFSYVAVDDEGALSDEATVTLSVLRTNAAPQISGTASGSVQQGANYRFAPTASDADGDSLTFSIQNKPAWASFDPATGVLSGVPGNTEVGTSSNVIISVSDGTSSHSLPAFSITVVNVNDAPLAQADSYSLAEAGLLSTGASTGLLANDSDPDGDALSVQLLSGPAHASAFSLNGDGSFSYQHDGSEGSNDGFSYQLSDGQGGVASTAVSLVIRPVNDAPRFTSTAPTAAVAGATFGYRVVVEDPDSAVTLSLLEGPSWLSLEDNLLTGTVPSDASGDITVTLEASDGNLTANQRFVLTLAQPQQSQVALTGTWQGLPAEVGKTLALVLTAQLQAGPALSDAVLELSLQGADMTTMPGCTLDEGVQRCPLDLALDVQRQLTLPINTQNQGDQTVLARVLDSSGNQLSELTTDVTLAGAALSQGDRQAIIARATALALIHDQGQPLLVVGTDEGEGISFYRFSSDGLVTEATLANQGRTRALATLDWNQDGLEDLVVINSSGQASALYLNQGDLHFSALQTLPLGRKVKVAKVDGDNYPDLLIGGQGLYLLRGNQSGSQADLEVVQSPFTVSEFALWPDGRVLITDGNQLALIALNTVVDQSGLTASRAARSTLADTPRPKGQIRTLQVADLDGDGQAEAVASYGLGANGEGGGVAVLADAGDGTLRLLSQVGNAAVDDLLVADFDGDNDLDLLAQHDNGSWQLMTNQGSASSFIANDQTLFHPDSLGLVGDLNGDGMDDILLTDVDDGALTIYDGIASLLLGPSADLMLSSELSTTANTNQRRYRLTVQNQGAVTVDQAVLTIQLPASLTVAQWPAGCVASQVGWQCNLGSLAHGDQAELTLLLDNTSQAKATISARVDGSAADPDTSNNSTSNTWQQSGGGALPWPWLLLLALGWSRRKARGRLNHPGS